MVTIIKNKQTIYELFMVFLASLSVTTIWNNTQYNDFIVWGTWGIFFIDFIYRFYRSKDKWIFIKSNPFLVIAAIPLDAVFQLARFARILHLLRLKTITKYYTMPLVQYIKKQQMLLVIPVVISLLFFAVLLLYWVEGAVTSLWHAFVQGLIALTFFGHSEFQPDTLIGSFILATLTIFGVILHGLLISVAVDYVMNSRGYQQFKNKIKRRNKAG